MKKYNVKISVEVLAEDKENAIVEARNTIYNVLRNEEFIVSCNLQ